MSRITLEQFRKDCSKLQPKNDDERQAIATVSANAEKLIAAGYRDALTCLRHEFRDRGIPWADEAVPTQGDSQARGAAPSPETMQLRHRLEIEFAERKADLWRCGYRDKEEFIRQQFRDREVAYVPA